MPQGMPPWCHGFIEGNAGARRRHHPRHYTPSTRTAEPEPAAGVRTPRSGGTEPRCARSTGSQGCDVNRIGDQARERFRCGRRTAARVVRRRAGALADAIHPSDGGHAADASADQARARHRAGPVRSAGRNDLDLVGPASGAQGVTRGLLQAVRNAALYAEEGRRVHGSSSGRSERCAGRTGR